MIPTTISAEGATVTLCMHDGGPHVEVIYYSTRESKKFTPPISIGEAMDHMPAELQKRVRHQVQLHLDRGEPYGPIRPDHAVDSWRAEGNGFRWLLLKSYGPYSAVIRAEDLMTVVGVVLADEESVMKTEPRTVDVVRAEVDEWLEANR